MNQSCSWYCTFESTWRFFCRAFIFTQIGEFGSFMFTFQTTCTDTTTDCIKENFKCTSFHSHLTKGKAGLGCCGWASKLSKLQSWGPLLTPKANYQIGAVITLRMYQDRVLAFFYFFLRTRNIWGGVQNCTILNVFISFRNKVFAMSSVAPNSISSPFH